MKYKVGDRVTLKNRLEDRYTPDITTTEIKSHVGHAMKIFGIFESRYLAICDCGKQAEIPYRATGTGYTSKQYGFWFLVDEMIEGMVETKVERFEEILK